MGKYLSVRPDDQLRMQLAEAVARRCSVKKVFLEVLQNSQETLVPESLF